MTVGLIYNDLDKDYYRESLVICESLENDLEELYCKLFSVNEPKTKSYEQGLHIKIKVNEFLSRFTSNDVVMGALSEVGIRQAIACLKVIENALRQQAYSSPSFEMVLAYPNEEIRKARNEDGE